MTPAVAASPQFVTSAPRGLLEALHVRGAAVAVQQWILMCVLVRSSGFCECVGKQLFKTSLPFMGHSFFFFLTPMPIVSFDAYWKAPPFILFGAYSSFQGKPLGLTLLASCC